MLNGDKVIGGLLNAINDNSLWSVASGTAVSLLRGEVGHLGAEVIGDRLSRAKTPAQRYLAALQCAEAIAFGSPAQRRELLGAL